MTEERPTYGDADRVTLRRTGQPPLRLEGFERVALVNTRTAKGPLESRWHELEIWRDKRAPLGPEQRLCIVVRWRTTWSREHPHDWAEIVRRADLTGRLVELNPLEHLVGYPEGEQFRRKQESLEKEIALAWFRALSDVFEQAGIVEEAVAAPSSSTTAPESARLAKLMSDLVHEGRRMVGDTATEETTLRAALDVAVRRIVELEDHVAASIRRTV